LGIGPAVDWSPAGNVIATLIPSRKTALVIFLTVASISWFKFYPNRSRDARCKLVLMETRTAVYGPDSPVCTASVKSNGFKTNAASVIHPSFI
jgi:hypothetical protein